MLTPSNYRAVLSALGFHVTGTGGGCTAWEIRFPSGAHVLITDGDLGDDLASDDCDIGAYSDESELIAEPVGNLKLCDVLALLPAQVLAAREWGPK